MVCSVFSSIILVSWSWNNKFLTLFPCFLPMKRPVCVSLRAWKKWQRIHKSGKNCKCIFRSNTIVIVNMSQAFTYKKTVKVNELKKNCWNSVCRVFQTKSKLLTWRFVAKRATNLTSATTHRDSYGRDIYDTLFCLLKRRTNTIFEKGQQRTRFKDTLHQFCL